MKQISKKTFLSFAALLCFCVILFTSIGNISAIEYGGIGGKPAFPDPENPRSKSVFIFTLEPGERKEDGVLVVNNSSVKKNLLIYATDSQKSTDGSFACEQFLDTKDNVGSWITLSKTEIELAPGTNEVIPFSIQVSENVSVGEENGCILIQEKNNSGAQSGLSLSFRTGIRVAVTIPGEQIRELEITEFNVTQDQNVIKTKLSVTNQGNVSIDANVYLNFNGIFNIPYEKVVNTYPVLRGDTSTYNIEVPKPYWGGVLFVSSAIDYDNSQSASIGFDPEGENTFKGSESYLVIVPPHPVALSIQVFVVLLIGIGAFLLYRKYSRQKDFSKKWTKIYITKEGDDIESIAKQLGLNWKDIAKFNKLVPPYSIKQGQKIKVARSNE